MNRAKLLFKKYFVLLFFALFLFCCKNSDTTESKAIPISADSLPKDLVLLNKKIAEDPNNANNYHLRALYYLKDKKFDLALTDMSHVLVLDSTKSIYYTTLADVYFFLNQASKSKLSLEKAIKLNPKNIDACIKLAQIYFYVKKYQESLDYINQALKIDAYNATSYYLKGMIYKETGDTATAVSSLQTAVEQDPDHYNAYLQLGNLHAAKKSNLAEDYYNNAIRINVKSDEAYYAKGMFYQDTKQWDKAVETYLILLKLYPDYKYAHYNLGVINFYLKKYPEAIKNFNGAIKADPSYFQAYFGRASCYEELGEKENAIKDYKETLKINPSFQPALNAMGKIK